MKAAPELLNSSRGHSRTKRGEAPGRPGTSVTIGGSHLGKASHVSHLGKRSGAVWAIAGERLWWPAPRLEVAGDLLDKQQRAAGVEFDHQATHDAGALKRLAQAQIDLPIQRIPADVAQALSLGCRRMVDAFARSPSRTSPRRR